MKRLRYLFVGVLFLLALPVWRLLDWANVTLPFPLLGTIFMVLWAAFFVILPLKLIRPETNRWILLLVLMCLGSLSWMAGPFTRLGTLVPTLTHCGRLSYAGFFYPIRKFLTDVHEDDLEVRNQLCWLVKMIQKVPTEIADEDLANYLNLMKFRLVKPEHKYRAALPWITFLLGKYLTSSNLTNSPMLVQNLGYWTQLYSEEISLRNYAWYEWPHSSLIKLEYGIIERNWENIQIEFNK
ncbi:MAG: hypothetical protein H0V66_09490 [Bdellovibrionales bacterium]|nr:hypothetical protein [Bdellovibrionales bacterium]